MLGTHIQLERRVPVIVSEPRSSFVERLFAEHAGALQAFLRRRVQSQADAQDLAQEVYLRMLRVPDQEAIRNPVLYLYTVANNLAKEQAVIDRRRASNIDVEDVEAHEQLQRLPAFDGELDQAQRTARLLVVL